MRNGKSENNVRECRSDEWKRRAMPICGLAIPGIFWRGVLPVIAFLIAVCLIVVGAMLTVSASVKKRSSTRVRTQEEIASVGSVYDCILVLGCRVWKDGRLSDMLHDRVTTAVELWKAGAAPVILMSGDHRTDDYDEVGAMKREAIAQGVPSDKIFLDHDGYSTAESIANFAAAYGGSVLIVTQEYHLYRALYLAEKYGLEADGVAADLRSYRGQTRYTLREILARVKDVRTGYLRPMPEREDVIPLSGNGDDTALSRP